MRPYSVAIASDHAGYALKSYIINYFKHSRIDFHDYGHFNDTEKVDYPDFATLVSNALIEKYQNYGVLICSTGIGMSIAANRNCQIRAALCTNTFMVKRARQHNDANILVLGAQINNSEDNLTILKVFLNTQFEGGRHIARLAKIS